jgi:hypothetical protein
MTTLIEIPSVQALHYTSPSAPPIPLSTGTLNISTLAPTQEGHKQTVVLTIGTASFPLSSATPLQKVQAIPTQRHASYTFTPSNAGDRATIGRIQISVKES